MVREVNWVHVPRDGARFVRSDAIRQLTQWTPFELHDPAASTAEVATDKEAGVRKR